MGYLEFLRMIKRLGDKLPQAIEIINRIATEVKSLLSLFESQDRGRLLGAMEIGPQEQQLEEEISAAMVADGATAAINWQRIRGIFQSLKESGVLDVIVAILSGLVI